MTRRARRFCALLVMVTALLVLLAIVSALELGGN